MRFAFVIYRFVCIVYVFDTTAFSICMQTWLWACVGTDFSVDFFNPSYKHWVFPALNSLQTKTNRKKVETVTCRVCEFRIHIAMQYVALKIDNLEFVLPFFRRLVRFSQCK